MTTSNPEYVRYCFECECNGEIPIDQPPTDVLKIALVERSKQTGQTAAQCLAELVKYCLLSGTNDPLHVYGPEFIRLVDAASFEKPA